MFIVMWKYDYQIDICPDRGCNNGFELCKDQAEIDAFLQRFEGWLQHKYWGASGTCTVLGPIPALKTIEFDRPYEHGNHGNVVIQREEVVLDVTGPAEPDDEYDEDDW